MMLRLCIIAALAAIALANNDCVMGDWGEWTEWTKLDCGEEPSGAAEPLRGKYQEHLAAKHTPSAMEEGRVPCNAGFSGEHPCSNVDQNAWFTLFDLCGGVGLDSCGNANELIGMDVYGWIDANTGEEHALMTTNHGTSFVRMTTNFNSTNPVILAWMEKESAFEAAARPIIVNGDFAFIVSDRAEGMQIIDLRILPTIVDTYPDVDITMLTPNAVYNGFTTAVSFSLSADPDYIFVLGANGGTESCSGGIMALDVSNPLLPTVTSCYGGDPNMLNARCMQYAGRDNDYNANGTNSEVCYAFDGNFMVTMDVSDKTNMTVISRANYTGRGVMFQGDIDRREVMMLTGDTRDEIDNFADQRCRTHLWNMNNLDDPRRNSVYTAEYFAIDHKQYVVNDYVYQANYEGGLRVLSIDQVFNTLSEVGYFDVFLDDPQDGDVQTDGMNDVYPFFVNNANNGHIVCSSRDKGLFILQNDIVIMQKMVDERLVNSDRYRYREILKATDPTTCPNTVEVQSRLTHLDC